MHEPLPLRPALRVATPVPLDAAIVDSCFDEQRDPFDALFRRARARGLASLQPAKRSGHLWRIVGEVAESIAEVLLGDLGYSVFWHIRAGRARRRPAVRVAGRERARA